MAKVGKVQRKSNCRHRVTPYPLPSHSSKVLKDVQQKKKRSKAPEIKQWDDATCSVCMEYPHNAVLLLCSSYDKGCRPYMCATSSRYSNCLEQYKKAYTKVSSTQIAEPWLGSIDESGFLGLGCLSEKTQVSELLCPLCRGQVKGWTVVEPARKYFNTKRRTCMQDNCSYVGTYKELRKHVKAEHPCACPREVDPTLAEKWKRLEHEREREDVMSTIRSSMPGAIVMGDYVIERNYRGSFSGDYDVDDYLGDAIFRLESFGGGGNGHHVNSSHGLFESDHQYSWDEEEDIDLNHDANCNGGFWGFPPFQSHQRRRSKRNGRSKSNDSVDATGGTGYRFPLKQAATAATLALTGDTIAQLQQRWVKTKSLSSPHHRDSIKDVIGTLPSDHDWLRALRMTSYGFLLYGPGSYAWYQFLDHCMPKQTVENLVLKVLLNQIILGPIVIAVVFAWNNLWQGKISELPNKYKKDALPTLFFGFRFWIPVSVLNFGVVPLQARVAFMSMGSIFWNFCLSSTMSK